MNKIIEDTVEYFRERLPYQGKGIAINFVQGKICSVDVNAELIGWVVENLIKNSLEACDPMMGRIMIATTMSADRKFVIAEFAITARAFRPRTRKRYFTPASHQRSGDGGLD